MYNGHADVTALLRPNGSIAATYYYDAFGNITDTTGSASNSITYAGYQYDKETGLYYLNARMYDPKTARFVQEDTYRGEQNDPLSLNLYTYCSNEPLMYTDPTGHISLSWFKDKVIDPLYNAGSNVASGAKKVGKKVVKKAGEAWDYVSDKAVEAWDTSTGYVAEKASEAYTSLKNDAKAVKQWAKTQATNTKEGFTTLTNSKKRKEAFELIDTYGSESDKILARVAAGTGLVAGTTAVAATAVYAAPLIAAAGASVTTSIMASSAATFAVANAEAVAWGTVGLVGGGVAVKSDIENKEYGQIPMDLATAVLGGLMLKGTASSYRSTVGMKPNVGVNGGSRLKLNYQQFADDAGVSKVGKGMASTDVASMAKAWLGKGAYPGIDNWTNTTIKQGTKVWGGTPGQSNFYTTEEVMQAVGNNATKLNQGLQVGRGNYLHFRPGMTQYEVTQDITAGYARALANPQYGQGGFVQYFINDYDNTLKPILSRIMTNR